MDTTRRPSRAWYVVSAGLLLAAVVVLLVGVLRLFSALISYEVDPVAATADVTIGDRPLAVWSASEDPTVSCSAESSAGEESLRGTTVTQTFTKGSTTWRKLGSVRGAPGSAFTLECSNATGTPPMVGVSDEPRVLQQARAVLLWTLGGGVLAVVGIAVGLTALLRRRARPHGAQ
ncbi:hypothetical protein ACHAAC_12390 [Aeromicrobium sp. CF4.19]|uniref:hypothetical protein n=1 Tax=Aeromicrobium sp. CF4.19 TaxID=3373082 RepID=UPI003EE7C726